MRYFIEDSGLVTKEVSAKRVEDYSLANIGKGGFDPKDVAKAMLWMSEVRSATKENPVVINKDLKIYAVGEVK